MNSSDKGLCPIQESKILAMEVISCLGLITYVSLIMYMFNNVLPGLGQSRL